MLICLEHVGWHPKLISIAKKLDIKLVCVPMWEWFRGTDKIWQEVDLFLCPNLKAYNIVRSYGFCNAVQIPWALDLKRLPLRRVVGKASTFIHNAGIVDEDDRKGTVSTIKAFSKLSYPNVRLIVRTQNHFNIAVTDERITIKVGDVPLNHLYTDGDVAVQPSKLEGLGFMVLEPVCCGIPTITSDIDPVESMSLKKLTCKNEAF